jgi:hypothetical protein
VGGLGIGTGAGLMREYFDESVHSRRTLSGLTGLPVLAVTPALTRRLSRWAMLTGSVRGRMRLADEGDTQSQTELMIGAMRRVRDALFDGERPRRRSVLVTSATSGEGRTTVALNLALIAAADGWRVPAGRCRCGARDTVEDARCRRQCRPVRPDRGARDAGFRAAQRHRHRPRLPAARQHDARRKPQRKPAGDRRKADRSEHRSRRHRRRHDARR